MSLGILCADFKHIVHNRTQRSARTSSSHTTLSRSTDAMLCTATQKHLTPPMNEAPPTQLWGKLRALAHQPTPVWFAELTHLIAALPTHEQDAAVHYIVRARDLPDAWSRWELELQSVFERFLDAPLESFNSAHGYHLYIKPDESACRQIAGLMGFEHDDSIPGPTWSEMTSWVTTHTHFPGTHPTSGYELEHSGHLLFDHEQKLAGLQKQPAHPGAAWALYALEEAARVWHDIPFFHVDDEGDIYWWPEADTLWRIHTDGTLFDALHAAFKLDEFDVPPHLSIPLCSEAKVSVIHDGFMPVHMWDWHDGISDNALRTFLGQTLGDANGEWERQGHHLHVEGRQFGSPRGNAGCPLRISAHCSPRWPSHSAHDDDGLGDFTSSGGLDGLASYVKGVVSWIYTQHGNNRHGGMCIVECEPGFEQEIAPCHAP